MVQKVVLTGILLAFLGGMGYLVFYMSDIMVRISKSIAFIGVMCIVVSLFIGIWR